MYAVNKNIVDTELGATRKTHPNELLKEMKELEKNMKKKKKNRRQCFGRSNMVLTVERATKGCSKCLICQGICASPIKASLCCKEFLGCKSCVDNMDRPMCPHCRSEDYSTIEFTAFEAVLEILHRNVYTL